MTLNRHKRPNLHPSPNYEESEQICYSDWCLTLMSESKAIEYNHISSNISASLPCRVVSGQYFKTKWDSALERLMNCLMSIRGTGSLIIRDKKPGVKWKKI